MSEYLVQCIECDAAEAFPATSKRQAEKAARAAGWSKTKYGWRCHRHRAKAKYNNRKTHIDGIAFHSAKEAARYQELKLLETIGLIRHLKLQYTWELQPEFKRGGKKEKPIIYICDFCYMDTETGNTIVEDVKGVKTQAYAIKRKLLLFKYPNITFLET